LLKRKTDDLPLLMHEACYPSPCVSRINGHPGASMNTNSANCELQHLARCPYPATRRLESLDGDLDAACSAEEAGLLARLEALIGCIKNN
jgi:hypothetical protein